MGEKVTATGWQRAAAAGLDQGGHRERGKVI